MRLVAILTATIVLEGLASGEIRAQSTETSTGGAVIVRVLPNTDQAGTDWFAFHQWDELILERVIDNPTAKNPWIHLKTRMDGTSRTVIYGATLAPGTYRFVEFSSHESCDAIGCSLPRLAIGKKFSRFEVTNGHLTDLGVLIQTETHDGDLLAFGPSPDPRETAEIVKEAIPELAGLSADSAPSWVSGTVPEKMPQLYLWTLAHAVGVISPTEVEEGRFIFATRLGTVISWEPGKRSVAHDVGARVAIESLLTTSNGYWVVGGELGLLRISKDRGESWQSARGSLPFGVVVSLNQWRGKIVATTLMRDDVYIHSADVETTDWKELAHYRLEVSALRDVPGVFPRSFLVDNTLITTVPSRKLAYLDLSTGQDEVLAIPLAVDQISLSADGILRCICTKTFLPGPQESNDLGRTWHGSRQSRLIELPVFRDQRHGVAYRRTSVWNGVMVYTEDGGAKWKESGGGPTVRSRIFYSRDGKIVYAASPYGEFWRSSDDGKSWEAVRSSEAANRSDSDKSGS